ALLIQQLTDTANQQHLMVLVVAAGATALHGLELHELLLPIAQDIGFDQAQLTHLTDGEVAFGRNGRQSAVDAVHESLKHECLCLPSFWRTKISDFTPSRRQWKPRLAPCS